MHDRVLIKPVEPKTKTDSGIMLAVAVDSAPRATVIQVGTGRKGEDGRIIPVSVVEGEEVLYNQSAAISVTVAGEKMLVVKESDIVAVWEI